MKRNITMKDIADKLGVSSVTVSKALNDKEGVSDSLKLKIKKVASEMGYRFNSAAKSIKDGLSYNIGVMIPQRFTGLRESFYLQVYQQIAIQLDHYGYFGILNILSSEDEEQLNFPRVYSENKVDGIIILGQVSKKYIETVQNMELPKLFLDFYDEHAAIDSIVTDNFYGAYEITNYLIRCGHREIAYVGNVYSTSSIQDRFLGYYKSLLEHGLKFNERYLINDRDEHGTYIDIELPEQMPTAFVCNCDQVAYLLGERLTSMGYRIPDDCSIVGFDNDVYATLANPPLTTVEVDIEQMARSAVKAIMDKVSNPHRRIGRMLVQGKIIYRDSVKNLNTEPAE
ncbi:substrate-binding domain-containing protein [Paenibacillus phoenicis]|jgi:LacI family transcriptional regulator|uniref:Substrate-binding domain-containing protein n=1 Tax=Paenibacillus phoenicis TaxID=554117 RepID=A0ABU5PKR4_9BACL|nr:MULTISPECIES: substrate-binding domain-containing protein [Paenibacillus]MCT2194893.1 substrate-binding domain-containing protein [Paenibacillus sp. p3-SID1389]MEA3570334.1 substrate-binding domain-containing protein [Paenibacillus phoenicis]SMF65124.1 transcriptional regulator, LacI family [Paenibacillus barengoltzii]